MKKRKKKDISINQPTKSNKEIRDRYDKFYDKFYNDFMKCDSMGGGGGGSDEEEEEEDYYSSSDESEEDIAMKFR